jgi:KDO2-lipid IV(A) lauroyltransferase
MNFLNEAAFRIISLFFLILGIMPQNFHRVAAKVLGRLWKILDKRHREIARDNLEQAMGDRYNDREIKHIVHNTFVNLTSIIFEVAWSLRLKEDHYKKHFRIEGLSNLLQAHQKRRGVLILTGHMGNWELLSITARMIKYPLSVVVRPLDFKPLDRFFEDYRSRSGGVMIPASHAMRKIIRDLKRQCLIAILLDQSVDWYEGVFVDFFGRRTCTNKGLALMALKTKAPVIPVFLARKGGKFVARFEEEVPLIKTGDKTKDIEANTQAYNRVIEDFIREYPDQWLWVHRRWKIRPYQPWPREK